MGYLLVGLMLYAFIASSCITSICLSRIAITKDVYQTQKFVLAPTCITRSPTFQSTNHIHFIQFTICATPLTTCGRKMPVRKFRIRRYSAWHYRAGACTPKVAHKLEDQHFNDCSCHTQCSLKPKCRDVIKQWVQGNKNRYRV